MPYWQYGGGLDKNPLSAIVDVHILLNAQLIAYACAVLHAALQPHGNSACVL